MKWKVFRSGVLYRFTQNYSVEAWPFEWHAKKGEIVRFDGRGLRGGARFWSTDGKQRLILIDGKLAFKIIEEVSTPPPKQKEKGDCMKCSEEGCEKEAKSKGLCPSHYSKQLYNSNKIYREKRKTYGREYWYKYRARKMIEDPKFFSRKNKEYMKKHREKFIYSSAKYYFKKLSPEERERLIKETINNKR